MTCSFVRNKKINKLRGNDDNFIGNHGVSRKLIDFRGNARNFVGEKMHAARAAMGIRHSWSVNVLESMRIPSFFLGKH